MKPLYVIVPLALTAAFALTYPYLQDRDALEVQRRALVARAESHEPRNETPEDARHTFHRVAQFRTKALRSPSQRRSGRKFMAPRA